MLPVLPLRATSAEEVRAGKCINIQKQEGLLEKFGGHFFEKVAAKFFWEALLCWKVANSTILAAPSA
jgi:hypothetical protein